MPLKECLTLVTTGAALGALAIAVTAWAEERPRPRLDPAIIADMPMNPSDADCNRFVNKHFDRRGEVEWALLGPCNGYLTRGVEALRAKNRNSL